MALERARLEGEAIQVLADAEAYKKRAIIQADNALQIKADTEIEIQKAWAQAFAQRRVPGVVMGGTDGGEGGDSTDTGQALMALVAAQMAQNLDYDRRVDNQ